MSIESIDMIKKKVEGMFGVILKKLPRKKIMYDGVPRDNKSLVLISPEANKLRPEGYGWVDITKIQRDIAVDYTLAIIALRLPDSKTYYYDFHKLSEYLSEEAMIYNLREGDHWKLHVYTEYIKIIKSGATLDLKEVSKRSLCISCMKDEDPNEKMLCNLNRQYQQGEADFKCGAYEAV
jgi:hypothetical protein